MTSLSVLATTTYGNSGAAAAAGIIGGLFGAIIGLAIAGVLYMGIFTKAGRPAWEAFVPFYNQYIVITKIVGRPAWWFWVIIASSVIPFLNLITWIVALVLWILIMNDLSKSFGKTSAYTVGLVLLSIVFLPILSYGQARYLGQGALMGPVAYGQPQSWGQPQQYGQQPQQPNPYGQQPQQPNPYGQQGPDVPKQP